MRDTRHTPIRDAVRRHAKAACEAENEAWDEEIAEKDGDA